MAARGPVAGRMTILLLSLSACSPLSTPNEPLGSEPGDDPCAGANALAAEAQRTIDSLEVSRDSAHFAGLQLLDLQAMALRAANEPIGRSERAALDMQFGIVLADLAEDAAADPAVHPAALGVDGLSVGDRAGARAAFLPLTAAAESLGLRQAGLQAEIDVA